MTPYQILLVRSSWPVVAASAEVLTAAFYRHLFEIDPSAAALFAGLDMTAQQKKLAALAKRHARYGVEHHHFDSVGSALLAALGDALGDGFTPGRQCAWADAYALVAAVMRRALVRGESIGLLRDERPKS